MAKKNDKKNKAAPVAEKAGLVARRKRQFVGGTGRAILVELPDGPAAVIPDATSTGDAWEKFKKVCGVVSTDKQPKFSKPGADIETDQFGVVVRDMSQVAKQDRKRPGEDLGDDWDMDEEEIPYDDME